LLAGTSHGIFVWQDGRWQAAGHVVQFEEKTVSTRHKGKLVPVSIGGHIEPRPAKMSRALSCGLFAAL